MLFRLIEKTVESKSVTAPSNSPSVDVGSVGGDSIVFQLNATAASSPNTASITLQGSLDGTNYVVIGSSVTVAANGVFAVSQDRPVYRYYRVAYAIASGSYTAQLLVLVKGDKQ